MRASRGSNHLKRLARSGRVALSSAVGRVGSVTALFVAISTSAIAATATSSFIVRMTIQPTCLVATNPLAFPQYSGAVDTATTTLTITCTNKTTYNVGLSPGAAQGATVTTRQVTSGANTMNYGLFSDSGHSTNWGQTIGTDTVAGTGNGAAQTLTVYGLVPGAQIAAPATYTDTIVATVTY